MEIKNRLFPYPVLCDETDDYSGSGLDVEINSQIQGNWIHLQVTFHLKNDSILTLIRRGEACYAIHVECSNTFYRRLIPSDSSEIHLEIPVGNVNGEVAVLALILANRKIEDFVSDSLNEDYAGETIQFDKGAILAYKNIAKINVAKSYEALAGNESFFSIVKVGQPGDTEIKPLSFNILGDRIQIQADPKTYEAYLHFKQRNAVAISLLVLPALTFMINELRNSDRGTYAECGWFIRLQAYYRGKKKEFWEDIISGDDNAVDIAQDILKAPIGNTYQELLESEV